jgi:hypothetical protein
VRPSPREVLDTSTPQRNVLGLVRDNLTIRTLMQRFTRLSLGFSKKLENLQAAVASFMAFYNFCWRPRKPGKSGRRRVTPAMAAGLADHPWTFAELFGEVWG